MPSFRLPPTVAARAAADLTDADLLARFRTGDDAAFEVLVRRHGAAVRAACRLHRLSDADADDVFQDTFLALVRQAAGVRQAVGGWLYRVAERAANRRRRRRRAVPLPAEPADAATEHFADADAVLEEVAKLPEKYRRLVVSCYLAGKTTADAAAELGWAKGTVLTRLAWARKRLHDRLSRRGLALGLVTAAVSPRLVAATVSAARRALDAPPPAGWIPFLNSWKEVMTMRTVLVMAAVLAAGVGLWPGGPAGAEPPKPAKAEVPKAKPAANPWVGTWVREFAAKWGEEAAAGRTVLTVGEKAGTLRVEIETANGRIVKVTTELEVVAGRPDRLFGVVAGLKMTDSTQTDVENIVWETQEVMIGQPFVVKGAAEAEAVTVTDLVGLSHSLKDAVATNSLSDRSGGVANLLGKYARLDRDKPLPPLKVAEPPTDAEVLRALKNPPGEAIAVSITKARVGRRGDKQQWEWECAVYYTVPSDPPGREIHRVQVVYIEK